MAEFIEEEEDPKHETTPTLTEVFKQAMDAMAAETRVSLPAEVIRYDHKKQLVDVRPYFKRTYADGKVEDPPMIYNVPVAFHRAGGAFMSLPIKKGHSVLLVFADRSMEKWLTAGTTAAPEDTRKHHISDAIAIPGCYPFSNSAPVNNAKDVIIKNEKLEIRVKPNGHIQVLNGQHELIKVLEEWMTADIVGAHNWKIRIRRKLRTFLEK